MIKISKSGISVVKKGFHLPEDHQLTLTHQALIRQLSLTQIQHHSPKNKYSFSATFSCEQTTQEKIKAELLSCLKKIQEEVKPAKPKQTFQLNIDLFPWTS